MANCLSCGAPLPANNNRCDYCHVVNDTDLQGKHLYDIKNKHSNRICPHCVKTMQSIELKFENPLSLERCQTCYGLFFDPGEIEQILESSVSKVFEINDKLITNINKQRYRKKQQIKYIKCPVCQIHMNRVNFGYRSGVIIDQCIKHGVWLDSGEITHLMEWKKAGGELLHAKNDKQTRIKKKTAKTLVSAVDLPVYRQKSRSNEADFLEIISLIVKKLFGSSLY